MLPTERVPPVNVHVEGLPTAMFVGDSVRVAGRVVDDAGQPVPNAVVTFRSTSDTVLAVSPSGEVTAVGAGYGQVVASVGGYVGIQATSDSVRVRAALEVDSVRPATVRFGDTVTIYAVLPSLESPLVFVGDVAAPVKRIHWANELRHEGKVIVWAPVGAPPTASVSLSVGAATSNASRPLTVIQEDLYEPNDSAWHALFVPTQGLFNPELAFERSASTLWNSARWDLYAIYGYNRPTRTITVTHDGAVVPVIYLAATADPYWQPYNHAFVSGGLVNGTPVQSLTSMCGYNSEVHLSAVTTDNMIQIVPARLPTSYFSYQMEWTAGNQRHRRYSLRIENGNTAGPAPDDTEFNDDCMTAPIIPWSGPPLNLNFHSALDVDWFRLATLARDTIVRIRVDYAGPGQAVVKLCECAYVYREWVRSISSASGNTFAEFVFGVGPRGYHYNLVVYPFYGYSRTSPATPMPYTLTLSYATTAELEAWRTGEALRAGQSPKSEHRLMDAVRQAGDPK